MRTQLAILSVELIPLACNRSWLAQIPRTLRSAQRRALRRVAFVLQALRLRFRLTMLETRMAPKHPVSRGLTRDLPIHQVASSGYPIRTQVRVVRHTGGWMTRDEFGVQRVKEAARTVGRTGMFSTRAGVATRTFVQVKTLTMYQ